MFLKWKNNKSDYIFTFIVYASVVLISLLILYPLLFVVIASVSDPDLVASGQVLFWPKGITLEGYRYIFRDQRIWSGYYNTIRYTFFGTLIALTITIRRVMPVQDGYGGARLCDEAADCHQIFFRRLIPTYLVVKGLHLVNTPYVLMILGSFSVFNLILCRTFL